MNRPSRIVILGGGVAGLTATYRLERLLPAAQIVLCEKRNRLGGIITTERTEGFVIEGGPDSFLSSKPRGFGLCQELGIANRLQGTREDRRRTYVMRAGELHPMPEGLSGLVPGRLEPLLESRLFSPAGKKRLAAEPETPVGDKSEDESLAAFIRRRFGDEVYDRLVEPLMAGIYAGNGELLSLDATFPQLKKMETEHGSLLRGIQAARSASNDQAPARPSFLAPIGGMQEIVAALEQAQRHTTLLTGNAARAIDQTRCGYQVTLEGGGLLTADAVICATPAHVTAELVRRLDSPLAGALAGIPYASTATVTLAYRTADVTRPLDGYGYVVPRQEGRSTLASTCVSSKFENRAPHDFALLRVFLGRFGQDIAQTGSDEELVAIAREELHSVLGVSRDPVLCRLFRWPLAMPQYNIGHLDRLYAITARLAGHPGIFLAGSAYSGVGIPDCIRTGEDAAQGVAELTLAAQAAL